MATSLENLERRLQAVEEGLTSLRHYLMGAAAEDKPAERGARLLWEAELAQEELSVGWNKAMQAMGVHGSPVGAETLQAALLASGLKPDDNACSRGIVEMREE